MKYTVKFTNQFKKDLKKAKKQNRPIEEMFIVIDILSRGEKLPIKYKDHSLIGNYKNARECHIQPDWLLIYEYIENVLVLSLNRIGTHSELFKKINIITRLNSEFFYLQIKK